MRIDVVITTADVDTAGEQLIGIKWKLIADRIDDGACRPAAVVSGDRRSTPGSRPVNPVAGRTNPARPGRETDGRRDLRL